jgi:hypothetical protein
MDFYLCASTHNRSVSVSYEYRSFWKSLKITFTAVSWWHRQTTSHQHKEPIHFVLRYEPQTWTYSATWLDITGTKRNNNNFTLYISFLGARCWWRSWLRQCATSRKVAGSIPDGVHGVFYWHNPSGRTMALGLTQPLTEMSTRNISWGVKTAGA